MSLKDRFANHSDTPAEQPQPEEQKSVELYDTAGHARNICFVQADGSMTFLNYAYLVEASCNSEKKLIELVFTTHLISLHGTNLSGLFEQLFKHSVYRIIEKNDRYIELSEAPVDFVSSIKIINKTT